VGGGGWGGKGGRAGNDGGKEGSPRNMTSMGTAEEKSNTRNYQVKVLLRRTHSESFSLLSGLTKNEENETKFYLKRRKGRRFYCSSVEWGDGAKAVGPSQGSKGKKETRKKASE